MHGFHSLLHPCHRSGSGTLWRHWSYFRQCTGPPIHQFGWTCIARIFDMRPKCHRPVCSVNYTSQSLVIWSQSVNAQFDKGEHHARPHIYERYSAGVLLGAAKPGGLAVLLLLRRELTLTDVEPSAVNHRSGSRMPLRGAQGDATPCFDSLINAAHHRSA